MSAFGLQLEGFNTKRLDDIKTDLEEAFRTEFGQNIRTDSDSVNGQLIGIMAERIADVWDGLEDVYSAAYVPSSTNAALDDLIALAGATREGETFSSVLLTLGGVPATLIAAGSIAQDPVLEIEWVTQADATIGGGGTVDVLGSPAASGPITGLAGTITEIVTQVTDWNTVTNAMDADVGRDSETDRAVRARFVQSFRSGGGSSTEAVRAVLLNVPDVTEVSVFENTTDVIDADGRPPHSIEAVVRGGTDQAIIDAIWDSKAGGIQAFGLNVNGFAIDTQGNSQAIGFTRAIVLPIYITIEYSADVNPPSDLEALILVEVLDFGSAFTVGQDVNSWKVQQNIESPGIDNLEVFIGISAGPNSTATIVVPKRELADFDSSRIVFNRTN